MPITVTCPECNSTYRVADDAAGKAIKCKKCGARVPVPGDGAAEAASAGAASNGDDAGAEGGRAPAKKGGSGKLIAIIAGSLVGACCICTGIVGGVGYWLWTKVPDEIIAKVGKDKAVGAGGGGRVVLETKATLTDKDPPKANGKPAKEYKVKLDQGKNYVIDMKADQRIDFKKPPPERPHDPYLRLLDPSGKQVASNDDFEPGVSLDSRIRYSPTQSGDYTIQATVLGLVPPGGMPFSLIVRQE
jgi:predicted Zn finger-like uncharacterized protein